MYLTTDKRVVCLCQPEMTQLWECPSPFETDRLVVVPLSDGGERVLCVGDEFEVLSIDGATGVGAGMTSAWPPPPGMCKAASIRDARPGSAALWCTTVGLSRGVETAFLGADDAVIAVSAMTGAPVWCSTAAERCVAEAGSSHETPVAMRVVDGPDGQCLVMVMGNGQVLTCSPEDGRVLGIRDRDTSTGAWAKPPSPPASRGGRAVSCPNPIATAKVAAEATDGALAPRSGAMAASPAGRAERGEPAEGSEDLGFDVVILSREEVEAGGDGPLLEAFPGAPALVAYMGEAKVHGTFTEVCAAPPAGDSAAPTPAETLRSWRATRVGAAVEEVSVDPAARVLVTMGDHRGVQAWSLDTGMELWHRDTLSLRPPPGMSTPAMVVPPNSGERGAATAAAAADRHRSLGPTAGSWAVAAAPAEPAAQTATAASGTGVGVEGLGDLDDLGDLDLGDDESLGLEDLDDENDDDDDGDKADDDDDDDENGDASSEASGHAVTVTSAPAPAPMPAAPVADANAAAAEPEESDEDESDEDEPEVSMPEAPPPTLRFPAAPVTGDATLSHAVVGAGEGVVYVQQDAGSSEVSRCLDISTGEDVWVGCLAPRRSTSDGQWVVTLRSGLRAVVTVDMTGILTVVNAWTGEVQYRVCVCRKDKGVDYCGMHAERGVVVISDETFAVFAVDINDEGRELWRVWPGLRDSGDLPKVLSGDVVPVDSRERHDRGGRHVLLALDVATGAERWRHAHGLKGTSRLLRADVAEGCVVLCKAVAGSRVLLSLDDADGTVLAKATLSTPGACDMQAGDGVIAVRTDDGVVLLRPATLRSITDAPFDPPSAVTDAVVMSLRRGPYDAEPSAWSRLFCSASVGFSPFPLCGSLVRCRLRTRRGHGGCSLSRPDAGREVATHAAVLGGSGELYLVDLQALHGPMRFAPHTDLAGLSKPANRPAAALGTNAAGAPSAGGGSPSLSSRGVVSHPGSSTGLVIALGKPCAQVAVAQALQVVAFLQLLAFAFQPAVPPSLTESRTVLDQVRSFGFGGITFSHIFFGSVGVVALLVLILLTSEAVEECTFRLPDSTPVRLLWRLYSIATVLIVTVAQVPVWTTLAQAFACAVDPATGRSVWTPVPSEGCFEPGGSQILYAAVAGTSAVLLLPMAVRLLSAMGQLDRLELVRNVANWSRDDRSPASAETAQSQASRVRPVAQVIIKAAFSIASVLLPGRLFLFACILVAGSALDDVLVLVFPPFHHSSSNKSAFVLSTVLLLQNCIGLAAAGQQAGVGPDSATTVLLNNSPYILVGLVAVTVALSLVVPRLVPRVRRTYTITPARKGE